MSIVDVITKAAPAQQLCMALMLLIGASTGVVYENHSHAQSQEVLTDTQQQDIINQINEYDPFWEEAKDVNTMMQETLSNPTEHALKRTNNNLVISREAWAYREEGANKELYQAYLKACEKVIDDMQAGKQKDTTEMDTLYNQLNPHNK